MEQVRHGIIEIETLRRYGSVPIGTRAVGTFAIWKVTYAQTGQSWESLRARIPIGNDPRIAGVHVMGDFTLGGEHPRKWSTTHRKQSMMFTAQTLAEYLEVNLTHYLEDQSTSTGAQRFRVVRIEWRNDDPPPDWVVEEIKGSNRDSTS